MATDKDKAFDKAVAEIRAGEEAREAEREVAPAEWEIEKRSLQNGPPLHGDGWEPFGGGYNPEFLRTVILWRRRVR